MEKRIYIHAVKDCRGIFIPLVDTETSLIEWQLHILRASGRNHLHKFVGISEKGIPLSEQPKGFQSEKKEWPGVLKVGILLIEACLKQILSHLFIYLVIIPFRFCLVGVYISFQRPYNMTITC